MNINRTKFTNLLQKYKWLFIPAIPALLFLLLILFILSPQDSSKSFKQDPTSTTSNESIPPQPTSPREELHELEDEDLERVLRTETLSDGSIQHILPSENNSRPNIMISKNNQAIFTRSVRPPGFNEKISDYTDSLGSPEKIVTGSYFYGPDMQTYIYSAEGVAFIANPDTEEVLEQQTFPPISIDEYIQNFGEDIINK